MQFSLVLLLCLAVNTPIAASCLADNCLRALRRFSADAAPFCSTYTTATSTVTTALPTFASPCSSQPTRISSACSCFAPKSTATPTCAPSLLQNTGFDYLESETIAPPWQPSVDATYVDPQPYYKFEAFASNFVSQSTTFSANFGEHQGSSDLGHIYLTQRIPRVCNGTYTLDYDFLGIGTSESTCYIGTTANGLSGSEVVPLERVRANAQYTHSTNTFVMANIADYNQNNEIFKLEVICYREYLTYASVFVDNIVLRYISP